MPLSARVLFSILFLLVYIFGLSSATGYYTISSPDTIRSNSKFNVLVRVHQVSETCKIRLNLKGSDFASTAEVQVPPESAKNVEFMIPVIKNASYTLEAEGLTGIIFKDSVKLNYVGNPPSVFVQTDRAIYKPNDLVQFRVVFLDQDLLPARIDKPIGIIIKDAENNRIQEYGDIQLVSGVYRDKLKLANHVLLGKWTIEVLMNKQIATNKSFEIIEYVLPLYEVKLDAPTDLCIRSLKFNVTVRALYTYGKPVSGRSSLTIGPKRAGAKPYVQQEFMLSDGVKTLEINLSDLRRIQILLITATVKDSRTNTIQNATAEMVLRPKCHIMEAARMTVDCDGPNDEFTYSATIKNMRGEILPPMDRMREVIISAVYDEHGDPEETFDYMDRKGIVRTKFKCGNHSHIQYAITYDGSTAHGFVLLFYSSDVGRSGLFVLNQNGEATIGQSIQMRLVADVPFTRFTYAIVGRGNIVHGDVVNVGSPTNQHTFEVTSTFEMIPIAFVYVNIIENGKILFYKASFKIKKQFKNKVNINTPKQVTPGAHVSMRIDTEPGAYVGLLAVDKSVLLLRTGNDFKATDILGSLQRHVLGSGRTPAELYVRLHTMTNAERSQLIQYTPPAPKLRSSSSDADIDDFDEDEVRKIFPETWFFHDIASIDEFETIFEKVPDAITSWVITGFSISPKNGFALTEPPKVVETFKDFFINLILPYSIKKGEEVSIPVVIFNYFNLPINIKITIQSKDNEFDFVGLGNVTTFQKSTVINGGQSDMTNVVIRPKVVGDISIKVMAADPFDFARDAILKKLKVEQDGITIYGNHDIYINDAETSTLKLNIPQDIVPESENITISVMNFIMGSMINLINGGENLNNLVRRPIGCGEQVMLNLVPNILVLKYLTSRKITDEALSKKAKKYIQSGYQQELAFKRDDGSFSAFGKRDRSGNTLLTAYVTRVFHEASAYITVDKQILKNGLKFLATKQTQDGSFKEDGYVYDLTKYDKVGLTAFVLLAFLENDQLLGQYKTTVDKAIEFLRLNVQHTADLYSKAIALYVLQKREHPIVNEVLAKLQEKATISGEHKWWKWSSLDVETTSYILMTLIELGQPVLPIIKWLVSKRNSNGGFSNSQETAVGLQALAKYAAEYTERGSNLVIGVHSQGTFLGKFTLSTTENVKGIGQQIEVPKNTREITFTSVGTGKATLQISYQYNIDRAEPLHFRVNTTTSQITAEKSILELCAEFLQVSAEKKQTNMALMEVQLPTGYQVEPNCCDTTSSRRIKRVEKLQSNTKVNIYFENLLASQPECVRLPTIKTHEVKNGKPGSIVVYDYYDKNIADTYFYNIGTTK